MIIRDPILLRRFKFKSCQHKCFHIDVCRTNTIQYKLNVQIQKNAKMCTNTNEYTNTNTDSNSYFVVKNVSILMFASEPDSLRSYCSSPREEQIYQNRHSFKQSKTLETLEKHWKNIGKTLEKHWKNIGKTLEKHWKNIGKTLENI